MHREIKIKQFPIVTTHWWPKTRSERFVWENEQYLYRFLPLVHNHVQVIWVHTHPVCDVCVRALWLTLDGGRVWSVVLTQLFKRQWRHQPIRSASCKYPIQFMQHQRSMWLVVVTMTARQHHASDTPSVKRWRRRARARAHTHVTHRMLCAHSDHLTWLCTRGKKRYKYCSFSHTNRSFRVLGHQCVVTMGNCLILISLCMFFFPLIETDTYTCHYMTDRLERFDLKTSKLDLLKKKRHLHLECPWGKLIDTKF